MLPISKILEILWLVVLLSNPDYINERKNDGDQHNLPALYIILRLERWAIPI